MKEEQHVPASNLSSSGQSSGPDQKSAEIVYHSLVEARVKSIDYVFCVARNVVVSRALKICDEKFTTTLNRLCTGLLKSRPQYMEEECTVLYHRRGSNPDLVGGVGQLKIMVRPFNDFSPVKAALNKARVQEKIPGVSSNEFRSVWFLFMINFENTDQTFQGHIGINIPALSNKIFDLLKKNNEQNTLALLMALLGNAELQLPRKKKVVSTSSSSTGSHNSSSAAFVTASLPPADSDLTLSPEEEKFLEDRDLETVKELHPVFSADFEKAEKNIPLWLLLAGAVDEKKYLNTLLFQVKIARPMLLAVNQITGNQARKLVSIWRSAKRRDISDYFKDQALDCHVGSLEQSVEDKAPKSSGTVEAISALKKLSLEDKYTPSLLQTGNPETKAESAMTGELKQPAVSLRNVTYEWLHEDGSKIPYSKEHCQLMREAESRGEKELILEILDIKYKISFTDMTQANVGTSTLRPIFHAVMQPESGPSWDISTEESWSLNPVPDFKEIWPLNEMAMAVEQGYPDVELVSFEANHNPELWRLYCAYRALIQMSAPDSFQERFLWYVANSASPEAICAQGFKRDLVETSHHGRGGYFTRRPLLLSLEIGPVKLEDGLIQTLFPSLVAVGSTMTGTQDMRQRYHNLVDVLGPGNVYVAPNDHQAFPLGILKVKLKPKPNLTTTSNLNPVPSIPWQQQKIVAMDTPPDSPSVLQGVLALRLVNEFRSYILNDFKDQKEIIEEKWTKDFTNLELESDNIVEYFKKLILQMGFATKILNQAEPITPQQAVKLITLWKCARCSDMSDHFDALYQTKRLEALRVKALKAKLTAQERSATSSTDSLPAASQPKEEKIPSRRNNSPRYKLTPYTRHTLQHICTGSYRIPNPFTGVSIDSRRFHLPPNSLFFNKHLKTSSKGKPLLSLDKPPHLYKGGLKGPGQSQ